MTSDLKEIANKALVDIELESLTMFKLLKTFTKIMEKFENRNNRTYHEIIRYPYTIENQQEFIVQSIKKTGKTSFRNLFEKLENRDHAIVTFLALFNNFEIQLAAESEE